jgi:outer membrane receptor protein involved in Fe transport
MKPVCLLAPLVFIFCGAAIAQTNKGGITGTVFDETGAVVASAKVVITNLSTGESTHLSTSQGGAFSAALLDPVEYRIAVESPGFKPTVVPKVKVDTATTASVKITLKVGELTSEVSVAAEAPLVNRASGTPGQTITERQIVEMPLNNRSVLDLALTVGNVTGAAGTEDPEMGSEIPTPGFNLFVNGGRAGSTSIMSDGARNTGVGLGRAVVTFSPDTVREFTVQTSNFSAEYGQTGGGVINMSTKSGSNRYEGLLYWYHRNPALNAAPFTTASVNRPQANRRQHQFGLTLGGPVTIPKKILGGYDGHNRTFFFLAFEPRYYYDSSPTNTLVPTDAMRHGDFRNLVSVPGGATTRDVAERFGLQWQPLTIYNQFELVGNQLRRITLPAGGTFPEFLNNIIPANMLDPVSQELMKYLPTAGDYFLDTDGSLRNYADTSFIRNLERRLTVRLDHHLTQSNRLSGRYTQVPIRGDRGRGNFEVGRDEVNTGGTDYSWSRQMLLTDTQIVSPSIVNELRLNYTYGRFTRNFPPGFDAMTGRNLSTELGLPSLTPGGLPEFLTGGGSIGWSQSQQNENAEHTYGIADTLSWVRGNRTWKLGVDLLQQRLKTIPMFGASGGRYEFNRNTTLTNSALTNATGGLTFAQFLLGVYNQATLRDTLIPYYYQWNSAAGFVQNDWKVRPNLTLNLGLRYSLQLPRTEKYNRQGAFLPELAKSYPLAQPVTLPDGQVITSALVPPFGYSGRGGRSRYIVPVDWNGWEPRFGFAWVPRPGWNRAERFVVRGGYGLSHAALTGGGRNPSPDFASGTTTYGFNTRVADPEFVARICCNKPLWVPKTVDEVLNIPEDGLLYLDGINVAAAAVSDNARVPAVHSWSTTFSYELSSNTAIELTYNGSRGVHLFLPPINLNPVPFALAEAYIGLGLDPLSNVPDPLGRRDQNGNVIAVSQGYLGTKYLGFEGLNVMLDSRAGSLYHGGTVSLRRRPAHGLSYTVNYTYGKGLDNASDSGGVRFTDFNPVRTNGHVSFGAPLSADWSVSTFDVKHAGSVSFLYELPFGRGRALLSNAPRLVQGFVGGWNLSGVGRIQGGVPLVVVLRDDNRLGLEGNPRAIRPDLVAGVPLLNPRWSHDCPVGQECEPYFNPAAFMRPVKGTLGNAPRTLDNARWPAQQFLDLSLQKNFSVGAAGRRRLQLRVDAINVLNHPVFKFGRDSDNGEIFALPAEGLLTTAQFNAWADFNAKPRSGTPQGDALKAIVDQIVVGARLPGTTVLQSDFFHIPVPEGFHSMDPNQFDITTAEGLKLYRLRQAYTPDRWGFLGARSPYSPRFVQVALKVYF